MSDQADDRQYEALAAQIRGAGVECAHYKDRCVKRRIAVRMKAHGVGSYEEYARVLENKPEEYERLKQSLTINVSRFFRNWPVFEALARDVIPALWDRPAVSLRAWSAGCAGGEEAYSIAAMFHDHALRAGDASVTGRVEVIGTDVDEETVALAERGVYPESALAETPAEFRERYFERVGSRIAVGPELRGLVKFERRDLLFDPEPDEAFDLVLCRNVLIYFERPAQEEILERLLRSLRRDGVLVLGRVEGIFGPLRRKLEPVSIRERIYRFNSLNR